MVGIQIVFVVSNIAIFAYFESQGALLGNSINIAGKNRFLTYDVLVQILKYISGFSNVSAVNIAMKNFESNLTVLRGSGAASPAMELEPLTSQYYDIWRGIDFNWQKYKEYIIDNIIKPSQTGTKQIPANLITELQ